MEQGLGSESIPASGSVDKSRVLNVRPLRSLVPIFPSPPGMSSISSPQASPFVCVPPTGPFPPGVAPFFPFVIPTESQRSAERNPYGNNSIPSPVPITSFRTPTPHYSGAANGTTSRKISRSRTAGVQSQPEDDGYSDSQNQSDAYLSSFSMHVTSAENTSKSGRKKGNSLRKTRSVREDNTSARDVDIESVANDFLTSFNLSGFDTIRRADGDNESVRYILMIYSLLRRRLTQIEDSKDATPGVTRRPDLRAGTILMNKGVRTNVTKRVGAVPGIEVGDIFFFRMELCLVGLHAPSMAGIDYMSLKISLDEEPVAVSIVSSGSYEDNVEDGDILIYSGQGGVLRRDKNVTDQKLERGNLALEKSLHRGNEVRVIRGMKDEASQSGKVYVYDGLYKIQESWVEKGKSGCNVFKYKLIRAAGQPEAFTLWKSIQQWKQGTTSRVGVILPDLTSGAESLPVSLVNDVDHEKGPAYFIYLPSLKYLKPADSRQPSLSCTCRGGCQPGDLNCHCIQKNGGALPYTSLGVLLSYKSLIYECGPSCLCPPNCRNRISQAGLKVRLEVFRTKNKGWGLRSWDPIRAGAFICEYAGEVIDKSTEKEFGSETEEYIFDATRTFEPLEIMPENSDDSQKIPFPLVISAKNGGNVARFMNHSCTPKVYWQPVLREESYLHIAFFAISHIPPMQELTYDYGTVRSGKAEPRRKKCRCESPKCRGYFY
ncbi:histone-lysine N-methyltransferase, H3 lysine-9 specific SUVH1-like [Actinidia eriantha]|uniref:histone-lysine N-methyltransferase, H3 lysine-9 specific SUVH1-like n=1 Tax=Actinidia eriantha TaxID=165200 RepID=UPI0025878F43|nr:histone-lysine N-methyltransferase, H3 lysine-9 specific SUVH1-like [Actinidia eriantha]